MRTATADATEEQNPFKEAAYLQGLSVKPVLTPAEVQSLYGISTSSLEKMRASNRGPAYVQLAKRGSVLYTRKALDNWLDVQTIKPAIV